MATAAVEKAHGIHIPSSEDTLPGTTVPLEDPGSNPIGMDSSPWLTCPGPPVNGSPTTVTLYSPQRIASNSILEPLKTMINASFRHTGIRDNVMPTDIERLQSTTQYLQQIGSGPGTFILVLCAADKPDEPLATVAAHRYTSEILEAHLVPGKGTSFHRLKLPEGAEGEGQDVWEPKVLAVRPGVMGVGVGARMMRKMEEEVWRRFVAEQQKRSGVLDRGPQRCWMVLTTIRESNGRWYERLGYVEDFERKFPPGHMRSPAGFTVVGMSKVLAH